MKKLLSVFLCVMMVLLMSVTPAAFAQEEELSKDVTINVYSWWDPTKVGMVNLKDGFEKKYADYNVKLNFVKISEYYKTMLTKLAGIRLAGGSSEAIDVMMIAFDKIPQFAANNTLMQLDAFASQEYLDSLYPSVREGLYFDGHLYATARDVTANCAILNTALFEKYNIELPAEDWTMDDFLALCRQFAKPEDGVWGYAIDGYSDTMYPWMYLFGADYMDRTTHTSLLDQPNQLKGFTTLYQLIEDGACMSVAQTNEFGGVTSAFATNHAAMLFGGLSKANGISDMTGRFHRDAASHRRFERKAVPHLLQLLGHSYGFHAACLGLEGHRILLLHGGPDHRLQRRNGIARDARCRHHRMGCRQAVAQVLSGCAGL